jgi:hypothetical protein
MAAILLTLWLFVVDLFKSRSRLEAENLFLRHQLNIALRRAPSRVRLSGSDRALLVLMTKLWPNLGPVVGCEAISRERIRIKRGTPFHNAARSYRRGFQISC